MNTLNYFSRGRKDILVLTSSPSSLMLHHWHGDASLVRELEQQLHVVLFGDGKALLRKHSNMQTNLPRVGCLTITWHLTIHAVSLMCSSTLQAHHLLFTLPLHHTGHVHAGLHPPVAVPGPFPWPRYLPPPSFIMFRWQASPSLWAP